MSPPTASRNAVRSATRLAAVQGLYQMDLAGTEINDVLRELVSEPIVEPPEGEAAAEPAETPPDPVFLAELLRGVLRRQREIDPLVDGQLAAGWRLVRVDSTLRAILRAGVYELMERADVPARVVINEYIEIAHAFFADDEPRVVNGVLDKLARKLRSSEFDRS